MTDYRRNRVSGGTYFFTVNLYDRRSEILTRNIDVLREAVRKVRARVPFHIDAWVVLPDHLHCLWTLPEGDTIRDDHDYGAHFDYIHFNPIRHGLVAQPADWPYSSFHRSVVMGLYPADWAADGRVLLNETGEAWNDG